MRVTKAEFLFWGEPCEILHWLHQFMYNDFGCCVPITMIVVELECLTPLIDCKCLCASKVFRTHYCLDNDDVIHWILHNVPFWPRDGSGGLRVGCREPSVHVLAVAREGLHHAHHHHVSSDCSPRCATSITADCSHLFPKHLVQRWRWCVQKESLQRSPVNAISYRPDYEMSSEFFDSCLGWYRCSKNKGVW